MPGPNTLSQAEIDQYFDAWAAGFFDGEGSISVLMSSGSLRIVVSVGQNRLEPLLKLHSHYGGYVAVHTDSSWAWRITGTPAISFLETIRPWLQVKATQADLAISFPMLGRGNHMTNECAEERAEIRKNIMLENSRRYDARA